MSAHAAQDLRGAPQVLARLDQRVIGRAPGLDVVGLELPEGLLHHLGIEQRPRLQAAPLVATKLALVEHGAAPSRCTASAAAAACCSLISCACCCSRCAMSSACARA